ncbi:hypothetical protein [Desulfovibrio gilichinskyi]|uniref:Uncharacterized protein n=1 Tax=Desulfovibrio gilichinskyi TaxID=1519643 RepID=A0A1X7D6X3_9BACT|nr:hypothetical protein [Desulfovibrio gilichinskyi]SMF09793.1 hypothetical protein SAMN06295933_1724 [Desulfovibrio gilichinskyi]
MKIGSSGSNISFSSLNVSNVTKEKTEETVQSNPEDPSKTAVEEKSVSTSRRPERLNLLAGSFVHQEADNTKYSTINLKSLRLENTLMTNFTNVIKGVMAYRSAETEKLIAAGKEWFVAKDMAFSDVKTIATDAPGKMLGQATGKEVTEESKEIKEDTEKRTEEVIEKKQEEKKTEAKEAEAKDAEPKTDPNNADAKVSESNPETVNPAQAVQSGVEAGSSESVAAGAAGVEAGTSVSKDATPAGTASRSGRVVIGEKVDVLV